MVRLLPSQTGVDDAVGTGLAVMEAGAEVLPTHPLASVTVTLYVPAAATVAPATVGFCTALVNPLGPVQLYVPAPGLELRLSVVPTHIGVLLDAVGLKEELTATVVEALPVHPATVIVTL